jgi:hypothetical protein
MDGEEETSEDEGGCKACASCRWWYSMHDGVGRCQRKPPVLDKGGTAEWPWTDEGDFCGEHQRRDEEEGGCKKEGTEAAGVCEACRAWRELCKASPGKAAVRCLAEANRLLKESNDRFRQLKAKNTWPLYRPTEVDDEGNERPVELRKFETLEEFHEAIWCKPAGEEEGG